MLNKASILSLGLLLLIPSFVFAAFHEFSWVFNTLGAIGAILNMLISIMITLALIVFFWGLIKFIASAGDEEGRKRGRQVMVWGIIILTVMISIWGIITILQNIFDIGGGTAPPPPGLPGVDPAGDLCINIFGFEFCFDF